MGGGEDFGDGPVIRSQSFSESGLGISLPPGQVGPGKAQVRLC